MTIETNLQNNRAVATMEVLVVMEMEKNKKNKMELYRSIINC
jgi:hypothetical protein